MNAEVNVGRMEFLLLTLYDWERRMAFFISASDETSGKDHLSKFTHGGFIASSHEWVHVFVPQWQKMLSDAPSIPYFHTKDLKSHAWCRKNNIRPEDAEVKIDVAIGIMCRMRTCRFTVTQDGADFRELVSGIPYSLEAEQRVLKKDKKMIRAQLRTPDFGCFLGYFTFVLKCAQDSAPGINKVDFFIEEKKELTKFLRRAFRENFDNGLRSMDRADLIPYKGEFVSVPKGADAPSAYLAVQAADLLLWFFQKHETPGIEPRDLARFNTLLSIPGFWRSSTRKDTEEWTARLIGATM